MATSTFTPRAAGLKRAPCANTAARLCLLLALMCAALAPWPVRAASAAAACTPPPGQPQEPRLITLAPSVTELVFAAQAGDLLVGTVSNSDWPPAARALAHVGDGISLHAEQILALRPDLVLGWQPNAATAALEQKLQGLNIPIIYINPDSLDAIPNAVECLGQLLLRPRAAQAQADELRARIAALPQPPPNTAARRVFIEIGTRPLYTYGQHALINDLLAHCAMVNIFADSSLPAPQVDRETVLLRHPELIVHSASAQDAASELFNAPRVYVPADYLHRPGPRMITAAEIICGAATF